MAPTTATSAFAAVGVREDALIILPDARFEAGIIESVTLVRSALPRVAVGV